MRDKLLDHEAKKLIKQLEEEVLGTPTSFLRSLLCDCIVTLQAYLNQ